MEWSRSAGGRLGERAEYLTAAVACQSPQNALTWARGRRLNHYTQRINRVIDHARRHFKEELDLATLAAVAAFSPHHFHRIFRATTGETPTAFVQRIRLERAAFLMMSAPKRSLTSIAHEVGFSEQSAFTRVFRQHYDVAPSAWDRRSRLAPAASQSPDPSTEAYAEAVRAARAEGPFEARIVDHAPCRMAYLRLPTPFFGEVLWNGYERILEWLDAHDVAWREQQLIGLSWDNHETTPIDQVRFDIGFTVSDEVEPEGEVSIQHLPAVRAVDVRCQGPLARIAAAWDFLYEDWFPQSNYEPADLPGIKRFRRRPDELGWENYDLDCSIAIRPLRP